MFQYEGVEFEELTEKKQYTEVDVYVYCRTFNHRKYIEQALDGFISQKTTFKYKVLIIDDASTDGTTDVLRDYYKRYPDLFHIVIAKKNFFRHKKKMDILNYLKMNLLKGKYVAFCEGDDYWINSNKLQIQYDYMQNHPECNMVLHNAYILDCTDVTEKLMLKEQCSHNICPGELILQPYGIWPAASMFVRKKYFMLYDFFAKCEVGDWPIQLYAVSNGTVYFMNDSMCVYRYMSANSWSYKTYSDFRKKLMHFSKIVRFLCEYDKYTGYAYSDCVGLKIQSIYDECYYSIGNKEILKKICLECRINTNDEECYFFDEFISCIDKRLYDTYVDDRVVQYISNHNVNYVMGTGVYSQKLSEELDDRNITIDGYLVSDNQKKNDSYRGKTVFYFNEIDYKDSSVGIIIAIKSDKRKEIEEALVKYGIRDYITPFWFGVDRL